MIIVLIYLDNDVYCAICIVSGHNFDTDIFKAMLTVVLSIAPAAFAVAQVIKALHYSKLPKKKRINISIISFITKLLPHPPLVQ